MAPVDVNQTEGAPLSGEQVADVSEDSRLASAVVPVDGVAYGTSTRGLYGCGLKPPVKVE